MTILFVNKVIFAGLNTAVGDKFGGNRVSSNVVARPGAETAANDRPGKAAGM